MTGHLKPGTVTFYTERLDPRMAFDLRLKTDPNGNVEVIEKFWVFEGENPTLAPAPVVYADLMQTGEDRCIETAQIIYNNLFPAGT